MPSTVEMCKGEIEKEESPHFFPALTLFLTVKLPIVLHQTPLVRHTNGQFHTHTKMAPVLYSTNSECRPQPFSTIKTQCQGLFFPNWVGRVGKIFLSKQSPSAQSYDRKRNDTEVKMHILRRSNARHANWLNGIKRKAVLPHKRYYMCWDLKIHIAEILNYCRRFREPVKCKCKETEFYKVSLHYTSSILKSLFVCLFLAMMHDKFKLIAYHFARKLYQHAITSF